MGITALLFSAGLVGGLGIWWLSMDRRRGKQMRELARLHHLDVEAVHDACVRAFQYGYVGDLVVLVRKAHPRQDATRVSVLPLEWRTEGGDGVFRVEEEKKLR